MSRKVFDLGLLSKSLGNPVEGQTIRCVHGSGNIIFVGGSRGEVVSYSIHESQSLGESVCEEWARQTLSSHQPVEQMESASALDRLFVLSDYTLHFLQLRDLFILGVAKFKGITCFDINWNPSGDDAFTVQLAMGTKKRQILLCNVSIEKMQVISEISTEGIPESLGYDGACIFYATDIHYYAYNTERKSQQPMFPINSDEVKPLIRRIDKEEFLLMGMEGLGVFANGDGVSNRPPLSMGPDTILSLTYLYPYIIALTNQHLLVLSIIDQVLKQQIPFSNGVFAGNFDGQISIATSTTIFRLVPVSWEHQIETLLEERKVEEALEVARSGVKTGTLKQEYNEILRRIHRKAAFIELENRDWDQALHLFLESQMDPREIMSLYSGILSDSAEFVRSFPPLHSLPSIEAVTQGSAEEVEKSWEFLTEYLNSCQSAYWAKSYSKEINTALVKIWTKNSDSKSLEDKLLNQNVEVLDVADLVDWLREHEHHFALSCLHFICNAIPEAIGIWKELESGTIEDPMYLGIDSIAIMLKRLKSSEQIIKFGSWLYERNRNSGMKILLLIAGKANSDVESVVEMLKSRDLVLFLEEVIFICDNKEEKFHTKLALAYMEVIKKETSENEERTRDSFRKFLIASNDYRAHFVLSKLQSDGAFQKEAAFVMGKMGKHEEALSFLAEKMKDYEAAEQYCDLFRDRGGNFLDQYLFRVYMCCREANDLPVSRIVRLLNKDGASLDVTEVLESLPNHWSLSVIHKFLVQSSARTLGKSNSKYIGSNLGKSASHKAKIHLQSLKSNHWIISEESRCFVCNDVFLDPEGQRLPDGSLAHLHCFKR